MLLREGFEINHKKTYRLYKDAGLTLQKRSKKKKYEKRGMPERTEKEMNARWSMDFVSDRTRYGSIIRVLTVIDEVTRGCLALEVDSSLRAEGIGCSEPNCLVPGAAERDSGLESIRSIFTQW